WAGSPTACTCGSSCSWLPPPRRFSRASHSRSQPPQSAITSWNGPCCTTPGRPAEAGTVKYYGTMSSSPKTPKDILDYAKKFEAKQLDLRFTDLPGLQQHISYPMSQLDESSFEEGFGIEGSSIRGWAAINESDMLLVPDASTAFIDPFYE